MPCAQRHWWLLSQIIFTQMFVFLWGKVQIWFLWDGRRQEMHTMDIWVIASGLGFSWHSRNYELHVCSNSQSPKSMSQWRTFWMSGVHAVGFHHSWKHWSFEGVFYKVVAQKPVKHLPRECSTGIYEIGSLTFKLARKMKSQTFHSCWYFMFILNTALVNSCRGWRLFTYPEQ